MQLPIVLTSRATKFIPPDPIARLRWVQVITNVPTHNGQAANRNRREDHNCTVPPKALFIKVVHGTRRCCEHKGLPFIPHGDWTALGDEQVLAVHEEQA